MLLTVNLNINELFQTIEAILTKKDILEMDESQIICGLLPIEYQAMLRLAKNLCIDTLPSIYQRAGNLA